MEIKLSCFLLHTTFMNLILHCLRKNWSAWSHTTYRCWSFSCNFVACTQTDDACSESLTTTNERSEREEWLAYSAKNKPQPSLKQMKLISHTIGMYSAVCYTWVPKLNLVTWNENKLNTAKTFEIHLPDTCSAYTHLF